MSSVMNLLMITPALGTGGAEWAFVRQANALVAIGCKVTCYLPYLSESSKALVSAIDPSVNIVPLTWMTTFRHSVICKLSQMLPINIELVMHSFVLRKLHRHQRFDAVNPHLNIGTVIACKAFEHLPVPIVETDHGDYALLMQKDPSLKSQALLLRRLDAMICPAHVNQVRIARLPWCPRFRSTVIPYAYDPPHHKLERAVPDDGVFTFGMVGRGVAEKGWKEAIAAFQSVLESVPKPPRLILVGGGTYLETLQRELHAALRPHVIFAGAQSDPRPWVESFDIGLLPSYFTAESLPNVIIECLAQGKPVIATRVGGIAEMLGSQMYPCGLLIDLDAATGRADVPALAVAMRQVMEDAQLRQTLAQNTDRATQRYLPATVAAAQLAFFQECLCLPHSEAAPLPQALLA
jgi:glycosyltransferase involved in cell wall biosynthesis